MATYELSVDDLIWERWRESLPEGTTPDRRLGELLLADIEGRVGGGEQAAPSRAPTGGETAGGEPPFGCPMCEDEFATLDERDYHLIEAHDLTPI